MSGPESNGKPVTMRDAMLARVPPHDEQAEMALLGSLLVDGERLEAVERLLMPEDFYSGVHQRLYRIILDMRETGVPIDALLVFRECERRDMLEETGGRDYILTLARSVTSPAHAEHYAAIVRDKAERRVAETALFRVFELASDESVSLDSARILATQWADRAPRSSGLRFLTAAEIIASTPERLPFVVDGLVCLRLVCALVAEAKAGKSCLVAVILRGVLLGLRVLGRAVQKVKAGIWVSEEDALTLGQTLRDYGLADVPGLYVLTREQLAGKSYSEILAAVRAEQARTGAEVIVFDTLSRLAGFKDTEESDSAAMERATRALQPFATRGAAVIVLHHIKKGEGKGWNKVRGSSAFAATVDVGFTLEKRAGGLRRLECLGGRASGWVEVLDYQRVEDITALGPRYRFDVEAAARTDEAARAADLVAKVKVALRLDPACSFRALKNAVKVSADTLRACLADGIGKWFRIEKAVKRGESDRHYLVPEAGEGVSLRPSLEEGARSTPPLLAGPSVPAVPECAPGTPSTPAEDAALLALVAQRPGCSHEAVARVLGWTPRRVEDAAARLHAAGSLVMETAEGGGFYTLRPAAQASAAPCPVPSTAAGSARVCETADHGRRAAREEH